MSVGHILFGFDGRLNRARWWGFNILATIALIIVLFVMQVLAALLIPTQNGVLIFTLIGYLPFLWIFAALGVKRLHDRDKGGALLVFYYVVPFLIYLLTLYIVLGSAGLAAALNPTASSALTSAAVTPTGLTTRVFFIFLLQLASFGIWVWSLVDLGFLDGTPGWNRFGPDPAAKSYNING